MIVISGSAELAPEEDPSLSLKEGDVIFIPAALKTAQVVEASKEFCAYRAYTPLA
jgi:uncharacterized cupin superfamily protein